MNQREQELIAALAEGSLGDESEARSLLQRSELAQAEYRLQVAALEALAEVGSESLQETERADLHRDLWTELRSEQAKSRSTTGIYGWSLAAAALFVVVGLAAVLSGGVLGGAGSDGGDSLETMAESAETTMAAGEAFDAAGDSGGAALAPPEARRYFAEQAERLRRDELSNRQADEDAADRDCLAAAGLTDHEVVAVVGEDEEAGVPGRYLAAVPAGETIGPDTPIHFVDSDSCEPVYTDR